MQHKPVALVTGASRGIGRGIAVELASSDFTVIGVSRNYDPANKTKGLFEVKKTIEKKGGRFYPFHTDIAVVEDHQDLVNRIINQFGRIDLLVNNAGVAPDKRLDILQTTETSFDKVLAINTRGPFFLTQRVAKKMIELSKTKLNHQPCIIFISSISAYFSSLNRAEYCISKAAISHMSRIFAHRLAEFGINVYEIQPGIIQTDMTSSVQAKYNKRIKNGLIPQNRWGFPQDVAKTVTALALGYLPYSTGITIEVSGGMNINRL